MEKLKKCAEKLLTMSGKADPPPWRYENQASADPFIYQETEESNPTAGYKILFENTFPVARYEADCKLVAEARNMLPELAFGVLALAEMLRWRDASLDSAELPPIQKIVEGLVAGLPCSVVFIERGKGNYIWVSYFDLPAIKKMDVMKWRPLPPKGRTQGSINIGKLVKTLAESSRELSR